VEPVRAEGLPDQTPDVVPDHRVTESAGGGDADPGRSFFGSRQRESDEEAAGELFSAPLNRKEFPSLPQSMGLRESFLFDVDHRSL